VVWLVCRDYQAIHLRFHATGECGRNATKFSRSNRAKRLALREPECSDGTRRAVEALWPSRPPVRRGAQGPEQVKATY
jgi:hypothetical protein